MNTGGTESQSTNPFLMGAFEAPRAEPIFNPFAVPEAKDSAASSNPFLSMSGGDATEAFSQSSTYTNPFAQFLMGDAAAPTSTFFTESKQTEDPSPQPGRRESGMPDLLLTDQEPSRGRRRSSTGGESDSERRSPPRRPPPPRPGPPKETKDLILSVTGALEATSSDLLDRLQATRTPSPTPLRELNSPSPTAMIEVNDLLGDDDVEVPKFTHGTRQPDIQQEAYNIFDAIANLSRDEEAKAEPTPPAPPSRPPPPQLPIQCESDLSNLFPAGKTESPRLPMETRDSPYTSRKSSLVSETSRRSSIDHVAVREAPPLPPPPVPISTPTVFEPPAEPTETQSRNSADGARLIFAPAHPGGDKKEPQTNYIAMRKASHDMTASRVQMIPTRKKYSLDYSGTMGDTTVIKEQLEQYSSVFPPVPDVSPVDTSNRIDNAPILETPKFPTVISTTPIMSYENIANENLYDEQVNEKEPSLIFDEAVEKAPAFDNAFPSPQHTFPASTPDPFASSAVTNAATSDFFVTDMNASSQPKDDFDAFEAKFESVSEANKVTSSDPFDPFGDGGGQAAQHEDGFSAEGFGTEGGFDEFLAMTQPQPATGDAAIDSTQFAGESWPSNDYGNTDTAGWGVFPSQPTHAAPAVPPSSLNDMFNTAPRMSKTDSSETPPTPLFDEDVSQPLEPFPRTNYTGPGWDMQIRYPIRKKFTGQRFWKKVFVRLVYQGETPHLELVNKDDGKETLHHEWPLQPCYAISDIGAQQYDQYGKIFTVKIQFVVYKERPGVRPGQVTKAERLTNKLSQFAAYAIQGDYQGVKEFGSDLKKLGLPVEHSPQISLICKLGSHNYEDMKQFSSCVEDALFRLGAHRDNIHINYKMEEVQITAVDELYVEQNMNGSVTKQIARVRLFFLGFLTGMPDIEIGLNDLRRQGKEVVGRHDIIPVVTEEWIRLENTEFHSCIQQDVYEETKTVKFKPPDACYLELLRFRVRPPKNRELPLQVKTVFRICGNKVDILSDILVPGFTSRKLGQIPCEDVAVRIPIPECWIYLFRTEKHFRYGSVKSAHRRTGKIKGIERFLGAVDTLEAHLIEVTSGHAKYEHHHRSIVWRMSRLPKEGQGAYTTHNLVCHLALTSYDQVPEELAKHCFVEFTMPITQVSHTTVRSVSICNSDSDAPPEKYVRHLARHEYKIEIEQTHSEGTSDYIAATMIKPAANTETRSATKQPLEPVPDSDSDSE